MCTVQSVVCMCREWDGIEGNIESEVTGKRTSVTLGVTKLETKSSTGCQVVS